MQVSAINSYSNVNFSGRKQKNNKPATVKPEPVQQPKTHSKMPLYAAMVLLPLGVGVTSCKPDVSVHTHAEATATATAIAVGGNPIILPGDTVVLPPDTIVMPPDTVIQHDTIVTPPDTIYMPNDTIYMPADTVVQHDTIVTPPDTIIIPGDTIVKNDTIVQRDTVYIPPEFQFPRQIEDSLNIWRGDYLKTPVDGDDGDLRYKALLYMSAVRQWDYNKFESAKLNLQRSDSTEARYDHVIHDTRNNRDSVKNDIRVTLVKPGEITVIKEDGTVTDQVSGLLFNEDGVKTFAHSNGKDKIYIYDKDMTGANYGKYVFKGTVEAGYLTNPQYGKNILLNGILSEGTEDHYTNVSGKVMDVADILAMEPEERLTLE